MQDSDLSKILRKLSQDYFEHKTSFAEYRMHRKKFLEHLDRLLNGVNMDADAGKLVSSYRLQEDITQPRPKS